MKISLKKLVFPFVFFISVSVNAQQIKIDSIKRLLQVSTNPADQIIALKDLAKLHENKDKKVAVKYYTEALNLANRNNLGYEKAVVYQNKSFMLTAASDYKGALKILDSALQAVKRTNNTNKDDLLAKINLTISTNYRYLGDFKKSVDYQMSAIKVFERLKNYQSLVNSYYNLSLFYKDINDYKNELESSKKAMEYAKLANNKEALFIANVALLQSYIFLQDIKNAKITRNNALINYRTTYQPTKLIAYHLISGVLNMNLSELGEANNDFNSSLRIAEENQMNFSIVQSKMQLSRVLALQKKFSEAERILKSSEVEVNKTNEINQKLILLENYARLYMEWGKYKEALEYNIKNTELGDSIISLDNKNYIASLEKKYETEKKDNQIKLQDATIREKNTLNYILISGAVALLIIGFLGYRNYRNKQKLQQQLINELETEKQLTATEAVLKGEEQERTRLAKDLHDGLGGMLSGIKYSFQHMKGNLIMTPDNAQAFERSMEMLDSSIKEMRRVAHNMMPEALVKFSLDTALKDFCADVNTSGALQVSYQAIGMENVTLDNTTSITIFRIVQELLNNTMKHAAARTAVVQLAKTGNNVSITVEDDGDGFDLNILNKVEGIGWNNIKNRVDFLKGKLDVKSEKDSGTSVHIEFNV
ncbi:tetratricopeptide repeat-containing sensor histidine kinase [Pedobacter sp.]|uniref:tetratricopeptide repeat-containing sensor histidine kinase n=1 Tax=Pedobacter sp. TaxID=1411316 RepID=UPI003BACFC6D